MNNLILHLQQFERMNAWQRSFIMVLLIVLLSLVAWGLLSLGKYLPSRGEESGVIYSRDHIIFPSSRTLYTHKGLLCTDGFGLFYGDKGQSLEGQEDLSLSDKEGIALYMIEKWKNYGGLK